MKLTEKIALSGVVALVLSLAASGCGAGVDSTATGTTTPKSSAQADGFPTDRVERMDRPSRH